MPCPGEVGIQLSGPLEQRARLGPAQAGSEVAGPAVAELGGGQVLGVDHLDTGTRLKARVPQSLATELEAAARPE